jgi:hypothetical protein
MPTRTNTLGYYENSQIRAAKSFLTLNPGANLIKLFTVIIYRFLYYTVREFVPGKPFQYSLMSILMFVFV